MTVVFNGPKVVIRDKESNKVVIRRTPDGEVLIYRNGILMGGLEN